VELDVAEPGNHRKIGRPTLMFEPKILEAIRRNLQAGVINLKSLQTFRCRSYYTMSQVSPSTYVCRRSGATSSREICREDTSHSQSRLACYGVFHLAKLRDWPDSYGKDPNKVRQFKGEIWCEGRLTDMISI